MRKSRKFVIFVHLKELIMLMFFLILAIIVIFFVPVGGKPQATRKTRSYRHRKTRRLPWFEPHRRHR